MFLPPLFIVVWSALSDAALHPTQVKLSSKSSLSQALLNDIIPMNLFTRAKDLLNFAQLSTETYGQPTRVSGSPGHYATLDYIYSTLAQLGDFYTLQNQTFGIFSGSISNSILIINGTVPKSAKPMVRTPPTTYRQPISGLLIKAQNYGCNSTDYSSNTKGSIVLLPVQDPPVDCPAWKVSEQAGRAGAVAAIVYGYPDPWRGVLQFPRPHQIATFSTNNADIQPYLTKLEAGETIQVTAYIDSFAETLPTTNIIAQTREGDPENCILLGAHSDSVTAGPGINDNGSGALSLLEVAIGLAKHGKGAVENCVRFAWWTAEEAGLIGSQYYMLNMSEKESANIRMAMDFDMLASPNFAHQIYNGANEVEPAGSEELRDLYIRYYEEQGQNYTQVVR